MRKNIYPTLVPYFCVVESTKRINPIKEIIDYPDCTTKNMHNDCKDYQKASLWKKLIYG